MLCAYAIAICAKHILFSNRGNPNGIGALAAVLRYLPYGHGSAGSAAIADVLLVRRHLPFAGRERQAEQRQKELEQRRVAHGWASFFCCSSCLSSSHHRSCWQLI